MITVSALGWARRHKRAFDAVLTLEDPDTHRNKGLRFHRQPQPAHLILRFVDLDRPAGAPYADWPVFRLATPEQVAEAIRFGQAHRDGRILVHCHAGIGRSTAIALALLADRNGPGQEAATVAELLRIRPEAVPNLHVVALADAALGRAGRLVEAVEAWDCTRESNRIRRLLNRRAHFWHAKLRPFSRHPLPLPDDL